MTLERRKAYNPKVPWSESEAKKLMKELTKNDFDAKKLLSLFPERSLASIRSKVRKLRIKHDLFGSSYRGEKEKFTSQIAKLAKPKKVFDAYAGAGHQTFRWIEVADVVFAAESMGSKLAQFKKEAKENGFTQGSASGKWHSFTKGKKKVYYFCGDTIQAAADLNSNDVKINVVDLDTCGSTLPTLSYFLIMLKPQHLVITHGEFHSMRFKREDVLRRLLFHRDINKTPLPLEVDDMSVELDKAVKIAALRAHNETARSFWLDLRKETWLGGKFHGMLRRYYKVMKPVATSDCLNYLASY